MTHRVMAEICPDHEDCIVAFPPEEEGGKANWQSHAHSSIHLACRSHPDAIHSFEGRDIASTPICPDCHVLMDGHPLMPYHHPKGSAVMDRGDIILIHSSHPNFDAIKTHPRAEIHSGETYADCVTCAPRAALCHGCRIALEG
jgi:hypothetical protein